MRALYFSLLTAALVLGCSRPNPDYCENAGDCSDPVNDYCDIGGLITPSGLTNTCVPTPSDNSCNEVEQGNCEDDEVCLVAATGQRDNSCVECVVDEDCPLEGATCSAGNRCIGARARDGLVALYTFDGQVADEVPDVSGFGAPLDLAVVGTGDYQVTNDGWLLDGDTLIRSKEPAQKIVDEVSATNAFSVEAWVRPASADQRGPARIVTMSQDAAAYNFTLGQDGSSGDRYVVRVRTATTGIGPDNIETVERLVVTEWTHLVLTRGADETISLYVNGEAKTLSANGSSPNTPGALDNWDSGYTLNLGDEIGDNRAWHGEYALVAIYSRDLEEDEVMQNFLAGR